MRTISYGETSVISTIYTALFGLQSYIVKGIRKAAKKKQPATNYFQPAALLHLEVHHNEIKNLQFIKEYQWDFLYQTIFFDVARNASAQYIAELLLHSQNQPETNNELFDFTNDVLMQLDKCNDTIAANLPLYYTIRLGDALGFGIQGMYSLRTPVLDLKAGFFTDEMPSHHHYLSNDAAAISSQLNQIQSLDDLEKVALNREMRRQLLLAFQVYIQLHITDFRSLKSLAVLMEVFD